MASETKVSGLERSLLHDLLKYVHVYSTTRNLCEHIHSYMYVYLLEDIAYM